MSSNENIPRIVFDPVLVEERYRLLEEIDFPVVYLLVSNVALDL